MALREQFENASETERPIEPFSVSESPEQWSAILDYEEKYSKYLEFKYELMMKEFEHFKQSQERKNTLKTLVSGTTSGEVTEFIHQYYAERPQLDKPKENVMGFEVQKELLPLLKTLVNHVCH